ncbi:MAG TPA: CatB-related O-acetyltransferase [Flavobacterium sp.]
MIKKAIRKGIQKLIKFLFGGDSYFYLVVTNDVNLNLFHNKNLFSNSKKDLNTKLYSPYKIHNSSIEDYSYIAQNSIINNTVIGKFCSIGPNLISGWGIHPTDGISTHPMFYSTKKQNGLTLSSIDKIDELLPVHIGNDVFIGMNVTILDGVKIGDGAIIGAGAVVSKDIPTYSIAVGNPIKIIKYRFDDGIIEKLHQIKWWNFNIEELSLVEEHFFNIDEFISMIEKRDLK